MAQRTFACTACGAPIEVPEGYFRAKISCNVCRAEHNRLTGQAMENSAPPQPRAMPAQPAAAYPPPGQPFAQRAPFPAQPGAAYPPPGQPFAQRAPYPARPGATYPAPFPGQPFPQQYGGYAPLPAKTNKGLFIVLGVVGGVVLLIMVLAAIPLLVGGGDVNSSVGWYDHTSADGGYSIKFPNKPTEATEPQSTPIGTRTMHSAECLHAGVNYQVIYFDLGPGHASEYEFDAGVGFSAAADSVKGRVVSTRATTVAGLPANEGVIENNEGYRGEMVTVRSGNRVYVIACERRFPGSTINLKVFSDTFQLRRSP